MGENEYIKKENRTGKVRDDNFGYIMGHGLDEYDEEELASFEYQDGKEVSSSYKKLDNYLAKTFIPENVKVKKIRSGHKKGDEKELYQSIQLNRILNLKLSEKENIHIIEYLEDKGIRVCGASEGYELEFDNYDYCFTYDSYKYQKPLEHNDLINKIREYQETRNKDIFDEIVNHNLRLVRYIAFKNALRHGVDANELMGYGFEGLLHSIERYNLSSKNKFSSYAYRCIDGHIKDAIPTLKGFNGKLKKTDYYYVFDKAKRIVELKWDKKYDGDPYMLNEIIDLIIADKNLSEKQASDYKDSFIISTPTSYDSFDNKAEISSMNEEFDDVYYRCLNEDVFHILDTLDYREKRVLFYRFGFDGNPRTLDEVGKMFGVTRECIRLIESKALRKLRNLRNTKYLKDYFNQEYDDSNYMISKMHDVNSLPSYDLDFEEMDRLSVDYDGVYPDIDTYDKKNKKRF